MEKKFPLSLWKSLILLGNNGLTIFTCLFLFAMWSLGDRLFNSINSFFAPSQPKIAVQSLIVNQIREASELTTTVFVTQAVVPTSAERKLGEIVVATTKLLYIAQGEVRAGIDLGQITEQNIKVHDHHIEVKLPPAKILDRHIDVNQSQVYDYNRGFLGLGPDVAPQLQTAAQRETLAKIVETACSKRILEEANEKAVFTVTKLLNTTGIKEVKVTTAPVDKCQFP
jgi:Protein of unknown function (DUF4230)